MKHEIIKKFFRFLIIALCFTSFNNNLEAKEQKNKHTRTKKSQNFNKKAKLTWLQFMAGDNNLEPYIEFNRKMMQREGVPDNMNLLLYMCTHRSGEPKMATKAIVKGKKTIIVDKIPGVDSGDKNSVIDACKWGTSFPAEHFCLTLWDHGSGPLNKRARRGICYDDTTGHFLSDTDLRDIAAYVSKNCLKGKKIDGYFFDACLMGSVEIAAAIQPYARYMIASEQTIPAIGWPYHFILKAFKEGNHGIEAFGRSIIASYKEYYNPLTQDYTLSMVNLEKFVPLMENINSVSAMLNNIILNQKNKSVTKLLKEAVVQITRFDEASYADVADWYKQLLKRADRIVCNQSTDTSKLVPLFKKLLADGLALITKVIVASVQGSRFARAGGLFIYLPANDIDPSYVSSHWARTTNWTTFLKNYLKL